MSDIFGSVTNPQDLPRSVETHLRKWIDTFLAAVERKAGYDPPYYARPASYQKVNLIEGLPGEDSSPAILIITRGGNGTPERTRTGGQPPRSGSYSIPMDLGIAVFTAGYEEDGAREVAGAYIWAIAACMLHRRDLDGLLDGKIRVESWDDFRMDDVAGEEARTRSILRMEFTVRINDFIDFSAGPVTADPPTDPYVPPGDWPTVAEHIESIDKEDHT